MASATKLPWFRDAATMKVVLGGRWRSHDKWRCLTDLLAMMPERAGEPSDKMDGPAATGQFLREVSLINLVVELVQNDLDADATRTSIDFGEHGLLCKGDGELLNSKA